MAKFTVTIKSECIEHRIVLDFAEKYHGVLGNTKSANWFIFETYEDARSFYGAVSSYLSACEPGPPQQQSDTAKLLRDLEADVQNNAK